MPAANGLPSISHAEWVSLKTLIYNVAGIALSQEKKILLVSRLNRRLNALGLRSFTEYYNRVTRNDPTGTELQALVNAITTNKTEFFREPHHFKILEDWLNSSEEGGKSARLRGLRIWCAASSTGEEPYTIAAVVKASVSRAEWNRTSITATDLDTAVLQEAEAAVYHESDIATLSDAWRRSIFLRGKGPHKEVYRVRPELRARVQFQQLNLAKRGWAIKKPLDIIFCRNVLIYFDKPTQLEVVQRACGLLAPHGLLFLGHSEGLTGITLHLEPVAHTVYRPSGYSSDTAHASVPRLQAAVSLDSDFGSKRGQFLSGSEGWATMTVGAGVVTVLVNRDAQRSCAAHFLQNCSNAGGARAVTSILRAMVRELQANASARSSIEAKLVATRTTSAKSEKIDCQTLLSVVNDWLEKASIAVTAQRVFEETADFRLELATGRVLVRANTEDGRPFAPQSRELGKLTAGRERNP